MSYDLDRCTLTEYTDGAYGSGNVRIPRAPSSRVGEHPRCAKTHLLLEQHQLACKIIFVHPSQNYKGNLTTVAQCGATALTSPLNTVLQTESVCVDLLDPGTATPLVFKACRRVCIAALSPKLALFPPPHWWIDDQSKRTSNPQSNICYSTRVRQRTDEPRLIHAENSADPSD